MIHQYKIATDKEHWEEFLSKFENSSIYHSPDWFELLETTFGISGQHLIYKQDKKINGLSFVDGEVISLKNLTNFKLPHIGFNRVLYDKNSVLFKGLGDKTFFYFIHSFFLKSQSKRFRFSYCEYGKKFISSFEFENIFGTQFHPEKSQKNGLKVLENFIKYD